MAGNGALRHPWDLATALAANAIPAGNTLYLRGGTYTGDFTVLSQLGTADNPITIRGYPGERAVLNGVFTSTRDYIILRDLEFNYSGWPYRETEDPGSNPAELEPERNVILGGDNIKFINCIIRNFYNGVLWLPAGAGEVSGCVIYNCGWDGPDRGHGHGMYLQNTVANQKVIRGNIVFWQFSTGIKVYTETGFADNMRMEGNICFSTGEHYHSAGPNQITHNLWVAPYKDCTTHYWVANQTYHRPEFSGSAPRISYGWQVDDVHLTNNYHQEGLSLWPAKVQLIENDGNYAGSKTLATTGNHVYVRQNDYETARANVAVYNQAQASSVVVDLTAITGLQAGDTVRVRNVQDYFVDIQTLVLDANKQITVDMRAANRSVEAPFLWTAAPTTFPTFGAFQIDKA